MLHPIVILVLVLGMLLIWFLPRKYIIVPFLLLAVLIPFQQQVVLAGVHLFVIRIVLLCAWIRILPAVLHHRQFVAGGLVGLDKVLIAWVVAAVVTYTLQWETTGALINRMGLVYTVFGTYFLLRHLIRTHEDVQRLVTIFAFTCAIVAVLMIVEQVTHHNALSAFGALAEPEIRNGRIRSQGPFQHPIIAGTCAATLIPAFIGLWWSGGGWFIAMLGVLSAATMAITSASSTPVLACISGFVALILWPLRSYMRAVRWSIVLLLVSLHVLMKAPVWALIGRINVSSGSTSWHRYALVDQFINHAGEWWLVGTRDNARWGRDMWDAVNWYVASGISGGLIGLILFVAIIVCGFQSAGRAVTRTGDDQKQRLAWSLGAALFANAISFFGIAYFDQSIVFWYGLLAMILATATYRAKIPVPVEITSPNPSAAATRISLSYGERLVRCR